ncbi:MAG: class I mannose-6-phosphate isomerase [Pseudothermotoga sp.]|nr:class I mannose-6-phosphate isomerase [Pseudothermotoga sp.]
MDYYVLSEEELKVLPRRDLFKISDSLASQPFVLEPLYIPGPWGGQWIKQQRGLGDSYRNCAWAFEAVTGDMHLPVLVNESFFFKLPFQTFLSLSRKKIMGEKLSKRFGFFFPVRVHYDDSYDGGNMAIQVHPNKTYVMRNFGEKVGQHEAYYIVLKKEGAGVYLGLKENVDVNDFKEKASKSHSMKVPFDYEKYVNFVESKVGDLFLIPAGTVHALGKNQVCLEIGTSYGYTFHIYDYLRPDLLGNLREIHIEHAFAALKASYRENWVRRNLIQKPRLIRAQGNSKEYLLGRRREMVFEVRRIELEPGTWFDRTEETFHILTLVEGGHVEIRSVTNHFEPFLLNCTRTVILPKSLGEYVIVSPSKCQILKLMVAGKEKI